MGKQIPSPILIVSKKYPASLLILFLFGTPLATLAGKCQVGRACIWDAFRDVHDWHYFNKTHGDCDHCETLCAAYEGCTGYECGNGYCASWLNHACNETRVDADDGTTTCRMSGNMTSAPQCPPGKFTEYNREYDNLTVISSFSTCEPCPNRTFSAINDSHVCDGHATCPEGKYRKANGTATKNTQCESCAKGSFTAVAGSDTCDPHITCPPGKYITVVGKAHRQAECAECKSGFFSTTDNSNECIAHTKCPAGTFTEVAGTATQQPRCKPCASGFFTAQTSLFSTCVPGQTGEFWGELRPARCVKSEIYTFNNLKAAQGACLNLGSLCKGVIHDVYRDDCPVPRDPNYAHYDYYNYKSNGPTYYLCIIEDKESVSTTACVSTKYTSCPNKACRAHVKCPGTTLFKGTPTTQTKCKRVRVKIKSSVQAATKTASPSEKHALLGQVVFTSVIGWFAFA